MTFGQPPDTAVMNFEGSRSMVWPPSAIVPHPIPTRDAGMTVGRLALSFAVLIVAVGCTGKQPPAAESRAIDVVMDDSEKMMFGYDKAGTPLMYTR